MPRNLKRHEHDRQAKSRRAFALERFELRRDSEPRANAASPTSMAVKVNPNQAMIEEFLSQRRGSAS